MAHSAHLKFSPTALEYASEPNHRSVQLISRDKIIRITPQYESERNHPAGDDGANVRAKIELDGDSHDSTLEMSDAQFQELESWFKGEMTFDNAEAPAETSVPLELLEDPIVYVKPFVGKSEEGLHYYEFHNPNGKSAIRVFLYEVGFTRFDTLPADAGNHFVLITKNQWCIKCLCTTTEQQGLEFGIKGLHTRTSAAELNNLRRLAEGE